ncbi:hypothetical protein NDN08_004635 [Rhodosorus marinus]|uniref:Uncharacterized protein n=1 Tax=Rhodosorus marinus TaxID=101924 RepID=A0AAV8ULT5_9RHOD|nr:hypothetical protein NDN08_004635 [Rhodosorus marinus]
MAFVSGNGFVGKTLAGRAQTCKRTGAAAMKMALENDNRIIVTLDDLKRDEKRKGWTFYSEAWNGRLAMLGLMIAIGTEQINPAHPTIIHQLGALVGQ